MLLSLEQTNIADRLAEILQESEKTILGQIEYTREALLSELEVGETARGDGAGRILWRGIQQAQSPLAPAATRAIDETF